LNWFIGWHLLGYLSLKLLVLYLPNGSHRYNFFTIFISPHWYYERLSWQTFFQAQIHQVSFSIMKFYSVIWVLPAWITISSCAFQLADAKDVMQAVHNLGGVRLPVLTPNLKVPITRTTINGHIYFLISDLLHL